MSVVFTEQLADKTAKTDEDGVRLTFVYSEDLDTEKRHALVHAGKIFHIAGQTVDGFDDNDVELLIGRVGKKLLQTVTTEDRGT
ncbi:hypothetical protein AVM02_10630 [Brucella anthropi]